MCVRKRAQRRETERMSDLTFKGMTLIFRVVDFLYPYVGRRVRKFGVEPGMTVVDYGCGPGRYAVKLAELVGEGGKVYAVDIHELAIEGVKKRVQQNVITNIEPVLIEGYNSTLPYAVADVVCAIDMFFGIKRPAEFLAELRRITKSGGTLVIDDGHQSRSETKRKIATSGLWDIAEETRDHLKCRPR
jgi:ubiquinone/menaquinone biosynthesis C-methylase UbiE